MMRTKGSQNKLMKIITIPARFLKKGRDMYVRSMMDYAHKTNYSSSSSSRKASVKTGQGLSGGLPKSFSTSVTSTRSTIYEENDDLRELIRANSTNHSNNNSMNVDMEGYLKQLIEEQKKSRQRLYNDHAVVDENSNSITAKSVPRSYSVGLGRIDEGKACEFDEEEEEEVDDGVKKLPEGMLRSRSHAVGVANRNNSLVF